MDSPILIASDHAGVQLKSEFIQKLTRWTWEDLGPNDTKSVDYSDYASLVASQISQGKQSRGILICGSGIGMCIAANRYPRIRAALVENPIGARLSREHNDANILCLGSRFLASAYAIEIAEIWLNTSFSNEPRHLKRVEKLNNLELLEFRDAKIGDPKK